MTTATDSQAEDIIVLNLSNRTDVIKLKENEQFQFDAKSTLKLKIESFLEHNNEDEDDSLFYSRSHNAITVCGGRGTGKSTFLRNTLSELKENKNKEWNNVLVLPVIDPTLISSKEHVLVLIISLIKKSVNDGNNKGLIGDEPYKEWHEALTELAGGLCQIDGIGSPSKYGDEWEDKTYILETGLEKARQGLNLEKTLNDFFKKTVSLLKKEAIVITFDDIDTQFERGWPVLETVRKYLTSNKVIILISGDIELYRVLVRRAVIESLGDPILKYDRPSLQLHKAESLTSWEDDAVINRIDRLEEQYLLKVLKPENRIHMQSLNQIKREHNSKFVAISRHNDQVTVDLNDFVKKVFTDISGRINNTRFTQLLNALLEMPSRTIWQFIKISDDLINSSNSSNDKFIKSLSDIFSSALLKNNIPLADINNNSEHRLNISYWKWLTENNLHQVIEPTLPKYVLPENNQLATLFLLSFSSLKAQNPSDFFSSALKNSTLSYIFKTLPNNVDEVLSYSNFLFAEEIDNFISRLTVVISNMGADRQAINIHIPDSQSYKNKSGIERIHGQGSFIGITEFKRTLDIKESTKLIDKNIFLKDWWELYRQVGAKKAQFRGGLFNRLSDLSSSYGELPNLTYLAMISVKDEEKGETSSHFSFNVLLASISRLLSSNTFEQLKDEVNNILEKEVLSKPLFSKSFGNEKDNKNKNKPNVESYDESESVEFNVDDAEGCEDFLHAIFFWSQEVKRRLPKAITSQPTFESSLRRYWGAADKISDNKKSLEPYLGNLIQRHIVVFLNAIIYEEINVRDKGKDKDKVNGDILKLNSKVPTLNDRVFVENLKKINFFNTEKSFKDIPIFEMFLSCPLIGVFLPSYKLKQVVDQKEISEDYNWLNEHVSTFKSFVGEEVSEKIDYEKSIMIHPGWDETDSFFKGLWQVLNTVPVIGDRFKAVKKSFVYSSTQEDAAQEEVAQEDAAQEEVAQEDAAQEGVAQEDAAQEGVAQEDAAQEDTAQEDAAKVEPAQEDPSPGKLILNRKTKSTLNMGAGSKAKSVQVEVRKKRTYVKNSDIEAENEE